ncbi:hypothetical protein WICANDRAFT_65465 [Wickerhamomyces anomalus NRRL Y-366-8]|uniref:Uncharacterized protein n=1 Tax=Wickerhamomyces anomalus (strain ATCC 58044 / CBS 1984 / NCYC 433 / NRRL Y-366-8) TaxID=683960 RepID=A0A1E3NVP3_WICAA|nr:uncharacterized protein WICANDRAFT_65465 [Wickerhamomyces anomalus NRRL Y-366-8]ODQ57206.1 hypothetical protein WICANDRAFT_65465 [Wickerhamomyces anomalus NRRL Y-366-8]
MLLRPIIILAGFFLSQVLTADLISSTESNEFGAYVNPNPKNICEGEELDTLTTCASEVLAKLDECKPDDLACECCALQSMKRDCYGLCPNTASGNFLAVLYDDCETMNDVNACNLPFKKHDTHVAKFLRPNARIPVEDKEPDFVLQSVLENNTNTTNTTIVSFLEHKHDLEEEFSNHTVANKTLLDRTHTANNTLPLESSGARTQILQSMVLVLIGIFTARLVCHLF